MSIERTTPRQQQRDARITEIVDVARRQLAEVGPAQLTLRGIARELDLVPSAVYRYFAGRDHILTALITDAYRRLGTSVVRADDALPHADTALRWQTIWVGTREWSREHPHEFALLYGSPVPGYAAPAETTVPAAMVVGRLARVVFDARARGLVRPAGESPLPERLRADAERVVDVLPSLDVPTPERVDPVDVVLVIDAWTQLVGSVSFELFGHYVNAISAHEEHLAGLAAHWAQRLGLTARPG